MAPLKGYGIKNGAVATTVAHDSHNLTAAGDNDRDILLAAKRAAEIGGGYVLVKNGTVLGELPLPVAGLISLKPGDEVVCTAQKMIAAAHAMGVSSGIDPFTTLSFLALPVIPELRLTDKGLFDVKDFQFIQ